MSGGPTIVVKFGDQAASGSFFLVELDETMNVDAAGKVKTQFYPGDKIWFLLHYDTTVQVTDLQCSSGGVTPEGIVTRIHRDQMGFETITDPVETSHIPAGPLSPKWYGNVAGLTRSGRSVSVDNSPAIGDITYAFQADLWRFDPPAMNLEAEEQYPVLVVIFVESK